MKRIYPVLIALLLPVIGYGAIDPITGPATVCAGAAIDLDNATPGGTWSSSNGAVGTVGASGIVTGLAAGTTTITYTAPSMETAIKTVTVNALPISQTVMGTATSCSSWECGNISLGNSQTGINYQPYRDGVIFGSPVAGTGSALSLLDECEGGRHTFTVTATSSAGCVSSMTGTAVFTKPHEHPVSVTPSMPNGGYCSHYPENTVVLANGDASMPGFRYALVDWIHAYSTIPSATVAGTGGPIVFANYPQEGGDYVAVAYDTLLPACPIIVTSMFAEHLNPQWFRTPSLGNVSICAGEHRYIWNTADVSFWGMGPGSPAVWSTGNSSIGSIVDISSEADTLVGVSPGTTSIIITLPHGCADTAILTVNPPPSAAFTVDNPVHSLTGNSFTFTETLGGSGYVRTWAYGDGATGPNAAVASHSYTATGVYTVTHTNGTWEQCMSTATTTVNVLPDVTTPGPILGPGTVLVGATIDLDNVQGGGAWSISPASPVASINSVTGVVTGLAVGTVTVTYTLPSTNYVTAVISVIIDEGGFGLPPIMGAATVCTGLPSAYTCATTGGTWSSSNTSKATVGSSSGIVTGIAAGTTRLTYTVSPGVYQLKTITVQQNDLTIYGAWEICAPFGTGLVATGTPETGTWSSSNTAIAVIGSATGDVLPVSTGSVVMTYTAGACYSTHDMYANVLSPISGPGTLCVGGTIMVTHLPEAGTWSTSNTARATINVHGIVTGTGAGTVRISYRSGNCSVTKTVTVSASPLPAPGSVTGASSVCAGASTLLSNAATGGAWSSGNTLVATVGTDGTVSGVAAGTVYISYTVTNSCGTDYAVKVMTVNALPDVGVVSGAASVYVGANTAFSVTATGGGWASSAPAIATVSGSGVVSGIAAGTALISYTTYGTCGSSVATRSVTVSVAPFEDAIMGTAAICAGATSALSCTPAGGTWSNTNGAVATVGTSGIVTGLAAGTATISYVVTGISGASTRVVTVSVPVSAGSISGGNSVAAGASIMLTASGTAGGTWSASNGNAFVSSTGLVTGMAAGTATISYTVSNSCGTESATTVITVNVPASATCGSWATFGYPGFTGAASVYNSFAFCNGVPYLAFRDDAFGSRMSVMKYNGSYWVNVGGAGFSGGAVYSNTLAFDGETPYVVYGDQADNTKTRVMKFNGTSWVQVGATLTTGAGAHFSLAFKDGTPYVTYYNPYITGGLRVEKYNGTNWVSLGVTGLSAGTNIYGSIAINGDTLYVAYCDAESGTKAIVKKYNGSSWVSVGAERFSAGAAENMSLVFNGNTPYVSFKDGSADGKATVMKFNGTTWEPVGSPGFSDGVASFLSFVVNNGTPWIAYQDESTGVGLAGAKATVKRFNGSNWETVGPTGFTVSGAYYTRLAFNNGVPYIMFTDYSQGNRATLMMLNETVVGPVTGITNVCTGATTSLSSSSGGGSWSSSNGAVATVGTSGIVTGVAVGTAIISYMLPGGCYATAVVSVGPPSGGVLSGPSAVCQGSTVAFTSSATAAGTWSSSNSAIASVNTSGAVSGIGAGTATISYTAANSCGTVIATRVVTVSVGGSVPAITGSAAVCAGSTTTLANSTAGGAWASGNSAVASVGTDGTVSGIAGGTALISYSVSISCGTVTVTRVVTVSPTTVAGTISGVALTCPGGAISLTGSVPGGAWASGNTSVATVGTGGAVSGVSAGTATISYTVTGECGAAYATKIVTVQPLPDAGSITGTANVCVSSTTALGNAVTGGAWSSGNTAVATVATTGVVSGVATGTATISYGVTGSCGTGYATRVVTVVAIANAGTVSGPATVCAGSAVTLSSSVTGGVWSSNNTAVAIAGSSSGVITGITPGALTISYAVTNGCGTVSAEFAMTVTPSPAAVAGPSSVPVGSIITLGNSVSGGTWTSSNTSTAPVGSASGIVTGVAAGTTAITYTITNGCYAARTVTVGCTDVVKIITTILGTGPEADGADGPAASTPIGYLWDVTSDNAGNVYVADLSYHKIRKISPSGIATTVAGTGVAGFSGDGGAATAAKLNLPSGIRAFGTDLYIYDQGNSRVRKVSAAGIITTVAGSDAPGFEEGGPATGYKLGSGNAMCMDASGNIYVASNYLRTVVKISTAGIVTTVAGQYGSGGNTGDGGPATNAKFNYFYGMTIDNAGNLYIADQVNKRIRKVTASTGIITNYAGTGSGGYTGDGGPATAAAINSPGMLGMDAAGNLLICDVSGHRIRVVNAATGIITTMAGTGTAGFSGDGGNPLSAQLNGPNGIFSDAAGNIYWSETYNHRVRKMTQYSTATITGTATMCTGGSVVLTANPGGGTWSSSNDAVATVGTGGTVTGVATGTATISYTASTSCGTAMATQIVTVSAGGSAGTISGTAAICAGTTTTLTSTVAGGTWTSGNTSVATVGTGGIVTGDAPGTATISYAVPGSCGTAYATQIVTVSPTGTAGTISGAAVICAGGSATFTSTVVGGTWSGSNTSVATVSTGGIVAGIANGTATISYVVSGSCGSGVATRTVTVSAAGDAGAITGTATVCPGATTTLSNSNTGGTWSTTGATIAAVDEGGVVTGISSGTTNITYTAPTGCFSKRVVTVNTVPAAIGGTASVCAGSFTTLICATPAGTWGAAATGIASVTATGVVTGMAEGNATVTYTGSNGCYSTRLVTVTAVPAAITGTASMCIGSSATLASATTGGSWSTSSAGRAIVGSGSGVVTGVTGGTCTITYAKEGCYSTMTATVNSQPNSIGGTGIVCEGASITLTNSTPGGSWVNNGAYANVGSSSGIVTGIEAGVSTISYIVASSGCFVTTNVTVNTAPSAITGTNPLCAGATAAYGVSPAGGTWVSGSLGTASVGTSGIVTGIAAGTSMLSYTLPTGCRRTTVVTVSAQPAAISGALSMCQGSATSLTAGTAGQTWSSSNGAVASVGSTSAVAATVTGLAAGTAIISYTNAASCSRTVVVTVTAAMASISGPNSICLGGSATFSCTPAGGTWSSSATSVATAAVSTGVISSVGLGNTTITYRSSPTCFTTKAVTVSTAPATAITGPAGVCIGGSVVLGHAITGGTWSSSNTARATINSLNGTLTGVTAGTATISYYTAPGCYRTQLITVSAAPAGIGGTLALCAGATAMLSCATAGGTWSSGNTGIAAMTGNVLSGVAAGTATISYILTASGCYKTTVATVNELPAAIAGSSPICPGSTTTFSTTPAGGTWATSAGIVATVHSATGVVTGVAAGTANITYSLATGCKRSRTVSVNPVPGGILGSMVVNELSSINLSIGTAGGTWSSSNTSVATIGSSTGIMTGVLTGTTTITYTLASTGCYRTRVGTVNPFGSRAMAAPEEATTIASMRIYPSPTSGQLTVEAPVNGTFTLFTVDGRMLKEYAITGRSVSVMLPYNLAAGVYMCRFEGEDGSSQVVRIVYAP